MLADIVVVATFQSVAAGTETMSAPEGEQATYRPVLTMTFQATEYLKGTGPGDFTVELRGVGYEVYRVGGQYYRGYLTQADALAEATRLTTARDTKYDDRPGILFLRGPITPVPTVEEAAPSANTYGFVLHHRKGSFDYSVDSTSRTWLPAKETSSGANVAADQEYIADGTEVPPPTISLSAVRTRIAEIGAMLQEGDGVEGWEACIYSKLSRTHDLDYMGEWDPTTLPRSLSSGMAKVPVVGPNDDSAMGYSVFWTNGPDGNLFTGIVIDDDAEPINGYQYAYISSRPLPAGFYTFHLFIQDFVDAICNFKPDDRYLIIEVTVTAPAGTLHEAFFDPVESGEDEVSPASFSVGGTFTAITGLEWTDGKVVLSLDPIVSLDGYTLDFIELDGTASLNLRGSDGIDEGASISAPGDAGTLTWSVSDEPWEPGDKLMLRIREDSAPPPPTPTP